MFNQLGDIMVALKIARVGKQMPRLSLKFIDELLHKIESGGCLPYHHTHDLRGSLQCIFSAEDTTLTPDLQYIPTTSQAGSRWCRSNRQSVTDPLPLTAPLSRLLRAPGRYDFMDLERIRHCRKMERGAGAWSLLLLVALPVCCALLVCVWHLPHPTSQPPPTASSKHHITSSSQPLPLFLSATYFVVASSSTRERVLAGFGLPRHPADAWCASLIPLLPMQVRIIRATLLWPSALDNRREPLHHHSRLPQPAGKSSTLLKPSGLYSLYTIVYKTGSTYWARRRSAALTDTGHSSKLCSPSIPRYIPKSTVSPKRRGAELESPSGCDHMISCHTQGHGLNHPVYCPVSGHHHLPPLLLAWFSAGLAWIHLDKHTSKALVHDLPACLSVSVVYLIASLSLLLTLYGIPDTDTQRADFSVKQIRTGFGEVVILGPHVAHHKSTLSRPFSLLFLLRQTPSSLHIFPCGPTFPFSTLILRPSPTFSFPGPLLHLEPRSLSSDATSLLLVPIHLSPTRKSALS
ncbi:uncharacterized protein CLUP02_02469 [Colletotrichum lupini]|uniref:Uncharacterized protein n=1 Tax=Colletotrichum lupini TaxID=145971 RepID=A0A9Q8WAU8_9PEZI|nr:uncharacterized protein CLUP02_02469 [Colletotrichum lupini]UQC77003.1 hypothetical protein CLUP02_02469 [Colletotrichum lupini]